MPTGTLIVSTMMIVTVNATEMSMPRNRHAKRNSCSREMSAVPREISSPVFDLS